MPHRAAQAKRRTADGHVDLAHQHRQIVFAVADGQQVGDFHHSAVAQPTGLQHVGVGQVDLLPTGVRQVRRELENARFRSIEQGTEDRRAVEFRPAEEIDAAPVVDQRGAAHVADDAVVLDGALRFVMVSHCRETPDKGSSRHR
jgi:hypothetical protein